MFKVLFCAFFISVVFFQPTFCTHSDSDQQNVSISSYSPINSVSTSSFNVDDWIHFGMIDGGEHGDLELDQPGMEFFSTKNDKKDKEIDDETMEKEFLQLKMEPEENKVEQKIERKTLKMLIAKDDIEETVEEVIQDWQEKVAKEKGRGKMEKEFSERDLKRKKQLEKVRSSRQRDQIKEEEEVIDPPFSKIESRKYFGSNFDPNQFRKDVAEDKPCNEEPLQVAEYYLFQNSHKFGVYHTGLFVCGIEIHFHHPGVEFWKPMEYSTRFPGGIHRDYRIIHHNGSPLYTRKSFRQIVPIVKWMKRDFRPETYHILTRNCLLFVRLLVRYITGLDNNGTKIDWPWSVVHPMKKLYLMAKQSFQRRTNSGDKNLGKSKSGGDTLLGNSSRTNWSILSSFRKSSSLTTLPSRIDVN